MPGPVSLFLIAGTLGYLAYVSESLPATILLGWTAVAVGVIAAAYGQANSNPFRKDSQGRLPKSVVLLYWPFLMGTWVVFHFRILLSSKDPFNIVQDRLILGRRLASWEGGYLTDLHVQSVVDLTAEFSEPARVRGNREYLNLPILDGKAPSASELRRGVTWLSERMNQGVVYVHCAAGYGRCAALAVAYLLETGMVDSIDHAVEFLNSRRRGIKIRAEEMSQLKEFQQSSFPKSA